MTIKEIVTLLITGVSILSITTACSNQDNESNKKTVEVSKQKITDQDVVGVWINHRDKDIHQQITFHKNHTWNENQGGKKNIYHGTWKITGKRTINLKPWNEKIIFTKGNLKEMTVVAHDHVLTKR